MARIFECGNMECEGVVDANDFTVLQVGGCAISTLAFACSKCRQLHTSDGGFKFARDGSPLYLRDGKVVKEQATLATA
jgi:hypothetical protein